MSISPLLPSGGILMFALVAFTVKAKTLMKVHLNVSNVLSARVLCQGTHCRQDLHPLAAGARREAEFNCCTTNSPLKWNK